MKSRSQNWKSAILTFVVAVILGALLIRLGPTPQQAQPRQLKSATDELNEQLFVDGVRNAALKKSETTTAPKNFLFERSAPAQASHSRKGWVRLPGEVPTALARATKLPVKIAADATLTLTIILKRKDQAAFDDYFRKVYEPGSPSFRHFLSQREISARFGPTKKTYEAALDYLRRNGFTLVHGSDNRLTLTVRGTRAQVERAFRVDILNYEAAGRRFFSNDRDPALPQSLASNVLAVIGLSNLAVPKPATDGWGVLLEGFAHVVADLHGARLLLESATESGSAAEFAAAMVRINRATVIMDATYAAMMASLQFRLSQLRVPATGVVQKIGMPSFSSFRLSDVADSLELLGRPAPLINQVSRVPVNGGAPLSPDQSDVLLGINTILGLAPKAQVTVYDAPLAGPGTSFQTLFNAMVNDGVTIISNSFGYCEDQTTTADVQSIDSILKAAAASGITVFNATGDFGSACRNGSANTIAFPADSPNATAVGGTTLSYGPGFTYAGETWWNGSTSVPQSGQGGFGASRFFARPNYQDGLISGTMRSVPDVVAPALPFIPLCEADAGGCSTRVLYGGTSMATPFWAALTALINDHQGRPLGFINPRLYLLGETAAFHSAASMGSDATHVGLGSPNGNLLDLALRGLAPGPVDSQVSAVSASFSDPLVPFLGYVLADASHSVSIVVNLWDKDGNIVPGKAVTLSANTGNHAVITSASGVSSATNGAVVFTVNDTTVENVIFTATADGVQLTKTQKVSFVGPPAAAGGVSASPTTVTANGSNTTTITVTLQDAKGNPALGKVINLSQGNGASIISATTATTDATGKVQFTAVDFNAETVTYTAVDVTDGNLPVPGSAAVNFVNSSGTCARNFGTAASGYSVITFASNFPIDCFTTKAPIGLAFDTNGNLFVGDVNNNSIYKFGPQGGTAGPATLLGTIPQSFGAAISGLTFAKDGRLYVGLNNGGGIVEVNPRTGAVIRVVATLSDGPLDLHVDPLSGDLFVSIFGGIYRITNFDSGPGTVTPYFQGGFIDGFVFAPDGTIYMKGGTEGIFRVTGTNTQNPGTATQLAFVVGGPDGIALEQNPVNPAKPFLYVNRNDGIITRIDTSALAGNAINCNDAGAPCTNIFTGGSRGDFVTVSPSGCLYATQSDRVIKITNADGTCSLTPTNPAPQLVLTPEDVQPSPAQGTPVTFTATLRNVSAPAGTPIRLTVIGPNLQTILVRADANGQARFTYAGTFTGDDTLIATTTIGTQRLASNAARVTWISGKHTTFLSLNQSPGSGIPNKLLNLTGTLVDVSATPNPAPVGGATVSFTLAGQTCAGTTDAGGTATCAITPNVAAASYPLTGSFAGTSSLLSSSANKTVDLIEAPATITPSIQFSASTYTVNEGCAAGIITVTRTGDTTGTATVDFSTNDATAQQRTDYSIGSGTLTFAPGETSKTFPVLVSKDAYAEGNETLTVSLGNWTGAALGTPNIATVTINDDTTVPTNSQPIDDAATFVCQHYHDFLARESDSGGAAFWTGQITQCGNDANCIRNKRIDVSNAFFYELEFQQTGAYVFRLYRAAFGNNQPLANPDNSNVTEAKKLPSYPAFSRDRARVVGGTNLAQGQLDLANAFVQRAEFLAKYPVSLDGPGFVDAVLNTIKNELGVDLTGQRAGLITLFNSSGRGGVMYRLADDNASGNPINNRAFIDEEYNRAFVATQYFGYLRRDSDIAGFLFWLGQVNGGPLRDVPKQHAMVCSFVTSDEYQQRFSSVVTHTNAECPH